MRLDRFIRLVAVASLVVAAWPSADARAADVSDCLNVPNSKCCYDCTTLGRRECEGPNLCSLSPGRYPE
jgi:hypothetical protein